ncbi:hypothetical protein [Methylobacterium marchantiae]|uniref:Uncharacterized protein n=1 Tax=Methylobacterium marchantiae TaxID=600331 RepID=A0ABW3X3D1_9HYPH|nr:hypothetical protein AIGOOFII_0303 [Methylobacterium marchantiae]
MRAYLKLAFVLTAALLGSPAAQAQSFGNTCFFGDGLNDCRNLGRTTQGGRVPNRSDQLPPAIGAQYMPTNSSTVAMGGAAGQPFSIDLGNGLGGVVSGSSTLGRSCGDGRTVSAGLRDRV